VFYYARLFEPYISPLSILLETYTPKFLILPPYYCKYLNNIHVIQGNILLPPFLPEIFDYVWSMRIIHHTPDTR